MKYKKSNGKRLLSILLTVVITVTSIQLPQQRVSAETKDELVESTVTEQQDDKIEVSFAVTSSWDEAFNANVTVKNVSDVVIDNWAIGFTMPHEITNIWNAKVETYEDNNYVIKNVEYNQDIEPGASISFGFTAKKEDEVEIPSVFKLLCMEQEISEDSAEITYHITNEWNDGYTGEINIKNISDYKIEDWRLSLECKDKDIRFYTATIVENESNNIVIKNNGYNANIKPGETVTVGFIGKKENESIQLENFKLTQIVNNDSEYVELEDGKIDKEYLEEVVMPYLFYNDMPSDNIKLSDDYDSDGLTLAQEFEYDTNPFSADTDEDGLSDYDEIYIYNTNPNMWDTDSDGMGDGTEITSGLNPLVLDTDGNGISDGEETVTQEVTFENSNADQLVDVENLPTIQITGKGDYSKKLGIEKIEYDNTILEIDSLVGTPFDFTHEVSYWG